ncbi:MAG: S-layer homology domain-containing protein [Clostridia bacterium]|nr:S-layer homology domain-containing protein [Clostridia bacterium]
MKKHLKRVISSVIAFALALSSVGSMAMAASFSDVPADASYAEAVANLTAIGIVQGDDKGKFNPDNKITRAEVAAMVVRAMAQESAAVSSKGVTNFKDVAADHWASGYINVASSGSGAFINGMGDGTFAPEANVTYAQILKMLVAAIGYGSWGVANGGYPTGYIATAKTLGITNGVTGVNADDQVSRSVVAVLINNAIDVPLLAMTTYSPTDPTYEILNGKDDKDYETVLTYYHNIYKVEGRITATNKTTGGSLDTDEVTYQIEKADNYNGDKVEKKNSDDYPWIKEDMNISSGINPDDYLNVYSRALIKVSDSDDATILSLVASAKNKSVSVPADAYDDEQYSSEDAALEAIFQGNDKGQIWYYASSEKTGKSTRYYLSDDFTLYVNGVEVTANETSMSKYVLNNTTGKVTFVDTPTGSSNSTDGKYDAVFVSYYGTAIVDSVSSKKVYFSDQSSDLKAYVTMEDEDVSYKITLNGSSIAYTDLKEDDVLNIAYDVTASSFADSTFYDILVSRDVAEGKVTEIDEDDGANINGTYHKSGLVDADDLTIGESYTLRLDAFGRIADYEKLASAVKYAIVHRAVYNSDDDQYKLTIYDTTASAKTFVIDDDYAKANWSWIEDLDYSNSAVQNRVITYTTNSSGEIKKITVLSGTVNTADFDKDVSKVAGLKVSDSSVIINKDPDEKTGYSVVKLSNLVDGASYTAYGYDKDNGSYNFVVITSGYGDYNEDTRFAVISKVVSGTNDSGEDCEKVYLYTAGSTDVKTLYTSETGIADDLTKGDVVIYKTNASGEIDEVKVIFDNNDSYVNYAAGNYDFSDLIENNPWSGDSDVELVFGPVVDKTSSGVSIGTVLTSQNLGGTTYARVTNVDQTKEYTYDSDLAVYVYDYNNSSSYRVSAGSKGSVIKTSVPSTAKFEYSNDDYIDWLNTKDDGKGFNTVFALAKVVNDEVTDLFIIIPKDE